MSGRKRPGDRPGALPSAFNFSVANSCCLCYNKLRKNCCHFKRRDNSIKQKAVAAQRIRGCIFFINVTHTGASDMSLLRCFFAKTPECAQGAVPCKLRLDFSTINNYMQKGLQAWIRTKSAGNTPSAFPMKTPSGCLYFFILWLSEVKPLPRKAAQWKPIFWKKLTFFDYYAQKTSSGR